MAIQDTDVISFAAATQSILQIGASDLPHIMKQELTREITEKTGSTPTAKPKQQKQSCLHMENLMPKHIWETLLNPQASYTTRLNKLKQFCDAVGLVHGNEPTYAHMTAIIYSAAHHQAETFDLNTAVALKCSNDLKTAIRSMTKRVKLPHYGKILVYPQNIEDFKAQYPDIYAKVFNDEDRATTKNYITCRLVEEVWARPN